MASSVVTQLLPLPPPPRCPWTPHRNCTARYLLLNHDPAEGFVEARAQSESSYALRSCRGREDYDGGNDCLRGMAHFCAFTGGGRNQWSLLFSAVLCWKHSTMYRISTRMTDETAYNKHKLFQYNERQDNCMLMEDLAALTPDILAMLHNFAKNYEFFSKRVIHLSSRHTSGVCG